jgi:hypothetical protein
MNLHETFILTFLVFFIGEASSRSLNKAQQQEQQQPLLETLFIKVRPNRTLELDCTEFLSRHAQANQTSRLEQRDQLHSVDNLIFIFKKNKLVFKKLSPKLRLNVSSGQDEGVYECGYYEIDQFGTINYSTQKVWDIRIDRNSPFFFEI